MTSDCDKDVKLENWDTLAELENWDKKHHNINVRICKTIEQITVNELQIFKDLRHYIEYMDNFPVLKDKYHLSYLMAKYHLKNIALNLIQIPIDKRSDALIMENLSDAFYDWLKVCTNPKYGSKINFYFETHNPPLFKEDEIKTILFENGELREMFKSKEWQIRLKKIKRWFLKRYDCKTSRKIHKNLINKQWFELLDFVFLRLICAILVGFIPFIFNPKIWDILINLGHLIFSTILIFLIFSYFIYECSKVIESEKSIIDICVRVSPIFIIGLLFSFLFSFVFYLVFSEYSVFSIQIGFFLASIAYFIGVLVQIIWEENTVAEPL